MINKRVQKKNNKFWDNYYVSYQKDSSLPGVKYPNEHLVRFLIEVKNSKYYKLKKKPLKILELGFGNITNLLMMNQLGFKVDGLEVSVDSVNRANLALKKFKIHKLINVNSFDRGDIIPKENNSYDIIVGLQCVYYNIDQVKFIDECNRILKKDGLIFFSYFTHRHEYMKHIDGIPGGIVKFNKSHPNPRLIGLQPFLYKNTTQLIKNYNKFFSSIVGREELDYLLAYQSWYYLKGIKRTSNYKIEDIFEKNSKPFKIKNKVDFEKKNYPIKSYNSNIWKKFLDSLKIKDINLYPNEHIVRFLSLNKRRKEKKVHEGMHNQEDKNLLVNKKNALELDPTSMANLSVLSDLGYTPYFTSFSRKFGNKLKISFNRKYNNKIYFKELKNTKLPFANNFFDSIFSEKFSYYILDQENYVNEVARILKPGGEIFLLYLAENHGYLKYSNQLSKNIFQFNRTHPNKKLINLNFFLSNKSDLINLWSKKFDVNIKYVENSNFRFFSSYNIVYGNLKK